MSVHRSIRKSIDIPLTRPDYPRHMFVNGAILNLHGAPVKASAVVWSILSAKRVSTRRRRSRRR